MHEMIRQQFGAAIDTLEGVIHACPDAHWTVGLPQRQPWYLAFHTLFWLDLYLSEQAATYQPPKPFTLGELQPDVFPEKPYPKELLLDWLEACRISLAARIMTIRTEEGARRSCRLHWGEMQAGELLLYNMRHVQHHAAQLNFIIRNAGAEPAPWVMRADGLS